MGKRLMKWRKYARLRLKLDALLRISVSKHPLSVYPSLFSLSPLFWLTFFRNPSENGDRSQSVAIDGRQGAHWNRCGRVRRNRRPGVSSQNDGRSSPLFCIQATFRTLLSAIDIYAEFVATVPATGAVSWSPCWRNAQRNRPIFKSTFVPSIIFSFCHYRVRDLCAEYTKILPTVGIDNMIAEDFIETFTTELLDKVEAGNVEGALNSVKDNQYNLYFISFLK